MASLDSNKAHKSFLKKGFVIDQGDHHWYLFMHEGKVVTKTKMSHNGEDLDNYLIGKMYKQCRISKNQFFDLVNCPLDQNGYIEILKEKGDL